MESLEDVVKEDEIMPLESNFCLRMQIQDTIRLSEEKERLVTWTCNKSKKADQNNSIPSRGTITSY